jgi:hypothetical protein
MMEIEHLASIDLLRLHAQIGDALRARNVTRSANNPTGDFAEFLFCKAFCWQQENNSKANYDAIGDGGTRFQIKGRRISRHNSSRQLSAIRDLSGGHFEFLAAVLFSEDYSVLRAAIIPRAVIEERSVFVARTNSHKFELKDDTWSINGVRDVTDSLRKCEFYGPESKRRKAVTVK